MLPDPLHPALVHFPIVFAALAPLFAAGAAFAIRRGASPRAAWGLATAAILALVVSGWVAMETGEQQEDRVERVVAERPIETHEEGAKVFVVGAAALLVLASVGFVRGPVGRAARLVTVAGAVAVFGLAARVGHSGGQLVYRHGAASAYTEAGRAVTVGGEVDDRGGDRDRREP